MIKPISDQRLAEIKRDFECGNYINYPPPEDDMRDLWQHLEYLTQDRERYKEGMELVKRHADLNIRISTYNAWSPVEDLDQLFDERDTIIAKLKQLNLI